MRLLRVLAVLSLAAAPLAAQSREEPSMAFTISGGMATGGDLWRIPRQELLVSGSTRDTVGLARRLRPGITASLGMSYYRSPHFGLNAEIAYFGLGTESSCSPPAAGFAAGPNSVNAKACTSVQGQHQSSGVIGFMAGATYRFFRTESVQPYVRVNAGVGLVSNSFIQTVGIVHDTTTCTTSDRICAYPLLAERNRPGATWLVSLAGGFSYPLGPGYRVRMEGRDLILTLPVATGPAPFPNPGSFVPTKNIVKHIPAFMIGFDVLLERRHTRRY